MKNKLILLSVVILVIVLVGTGMYLNRELSELVEEISLVDTDDEESSEAEYGTLAEGEAAGNIEVIDGVEVDTTVKDTDADGQEHGSNWMEVNPNEAPSDPNKKLSSGLTLGYVASDIEERIKYLRDSGRSEEDIKADIEMTAEAYGTTMEEINRLPKEEVKQEVKKPAESGNKGNTNNNKGNTNNNKGNTGENKGTGNNTGSGSNSSLVFKTDKWYTKEQKEAARDKAKKEGRLDSFNKLAEEWEKADASVKEFMGSPYDNVEVPDLDGVDNPFK